ncbi:MAG: diguanylate cyclase [Nitrosomonas sp.]|nr:diguanylate cyclase [Nitrosomonas sp.]UJO99982.1 MAG: diguanylate cyclase [Nitrosomonas sp.]
MEGLIVEPSRTYQKLLSTAIESGGLGTRQVSTGGEALTLLRKQPFDLVFIATHLQDMDGPMFSSQLRADSRTRQIPLVMITANDNKEFQDEAFSAGVTEIFSKHELDKITSYTVQFSRKRCNKSMSGHILYLENSTSMASAVTALLTECGYTVDHFGNGEKGLLALQNNDYDLVLADTLLKGRLNGHAIVKAIRGLEDDKKDVPLLVFSVLDDATRKVELLRSGVNDYVSKPLIQEELLARINTLISNKKLLNKAIMQQGQMHELAMKDPLTGLYNRYFLLETAPSKLSEAVRHSISCSLIMVDIDRFKSINDNFGLASGDKVLKEVAATLTGSIRREDIAARYGEEEFALLLPHCDLASAAMIAEKIRHSIEHLHPSGIHVTASLGVAELQPNSSDGFSDLLKAATEAADRAKSSGCNQVFVHRP